MFWVSPDSVLLDARDSHLRNPPKGRRDILDDEPDYGGFLRGRVARSVGGAQLVVVYCRQDALVQGSPAVRQLLDGLAMLPVPLDRSALVVSDNGDICGTVTDLVTGEAGSLD